ncbi:APC family permease [Komagataeibacter sp. FNDCF1]|uniref:APC family permease n=1 Tax=Komagataeibacter sp. FNDCF1 TaxID=2878681 RepID=UPI001E477B89|nr:APC family permease [Komagataeibacter sp. FNDCF1]MCE2563290.1 APC family permease [Komagataeibacter sp. FNDCF1]
MTRQQPAFSRSLSLLDLIMLGFGAVFGSGWLFAASHVAAIAGPASILSWLAGGIAVLLLGLVYCELAAALPEAGGMIRYPAYAHGPLLGGLLGFITVIAYSSLISIEIIAARQYAGSWFPALTANKAGDATLLGWMAQFVVLLGMLRLNISGVKTFALFNNIITVFKFIVPVLVTVMLLLHLRAANFTTWGFAPFGQQSIEAAVSVGGIIFAYLGLTPIIAVASEVDNPQRTIPIALTLSVLLATLVYILLQVAFIGSVPTDLLAARGWSGIDRVLPLPFHDIALVLGLGWLGSAVVIDAVISPTGTGNIYMGSTARIIYAWSRSGTFLPWFAHLDSRHHVPRRATFLTFGLCVFWMLPFPSWEALIGVVSSALIMSYAFAPVAAAALRRSAPDLHRPFRVSCMRVLGPVSFMIASLIVFWSGWHTLSWLLSVQLAFGLVYLGVQGFRDMAAMRENLRSSAWVLVYFMGMLVLSATGSLGGYDIVPRPFDDMAVALFAAVIFVWGERTAHRDMKLPSTPTDAGVVEDIRAIIANEPTVST